MKSLTTFPVFSGVFLLIWSGLVLVGSPSGSGPRYVPLASTPQPGKAPGMKVQLLTKPDEERREYAVIFAKGDEVASGLAEFAEKYRVTSAHFTAIGAFQDVTAGWMDRERKSYKAIPVNTQAEVLSLIGDIAMYQGKPTVHAHVVVGMEDGGTKGGHLLEAHVFPTLEVMVTVDPAALQKTFDAATGLTLINPADKPVP